MFMNAKIQSGALGSKFDLSRTALVIWNVRLYLNRQLWSNYLGKPAKHLQLSFQENLKYNRFTKAKILWSLSQRTSRRQKQDLETKLVIFDKNLIWGGKNPCGWNFKKSRETIKHSKNYSKETYLATAEDIS